MIRPARRRNSQPARAGTSAQHGYRGEKLRCAPHLEKPAAELRAVRRASIADGDGGCQHSLSKPAIQGSHTHVPDRLRLATGRPAAAGRPPAMTEFYTCQAPPLAKPGETPRPSRTRLEPAAPWLGLGPAVFSPPDRVRSSQALDAPAGELWPGPARRSQPTCHLARSPATLARGLFRLQQPAHWRRHHLALQPRVTTAAWRGSGPPARASMPAEPRRLASNQASQEPYQTAGRAQRPPTPVAGSLPWITTRRRLRSRRGHVSPNTWHSFSASCGYA